MSKDFVFDPASGNFVPAPKSMEDAAQSAPQVPDDPISTEFVSEQPLDDAFEQNPGGDSSEVLGAPETFYVLAQKVRSNPDGSSVIDVIIEVEDSSDSTEYEVRVAT